VAEHYKKDQLPEDLKTLVIAKEKRYGDVVVTLYRKKP
jgi:16S rRNA G966 N2-methylase RsmD